MSRLLIQQYLNQLSTLRKVSGSSRESVVREAFKDLLKGQDLHIGYEKVEPWKLKRSDSEDEKAKRAGLSPKCILKADNEAGKIVVDSETVLAGITPAAWDYRLGYRSALEWILDQ